MPKAPAKKATSNAASKAKTASARASKAAKSATQAKKQSSVKPSSAKRTAAKRTAAKKTTAPTKKASAAKKSTTAKPTTKKTAAKKTAAKKTAATKSAARKTAAENTAATKAAATKSVTKKTAAKKTAAKKAPVKKTPAKQAPGRAAAATRRGTQAAEPAALVVRSDEKPWTTKELNEVSEALHSEADRIRAEIRDAEVEIADLFRDGGDGAGHDQADVGSTTFERDHEMSLANHSREMLTQIEHALERIEDGSYGICENCGNPIGKLRLMAFPRATLCVSCKQRQERR